MAKRIVGVAAGQANENFTLENLYDGTSGDRENFTPRKSLAIRYVRVYTSCFYTAAGCSQVASVPISGILFPS